MAKKQDRMSRDIIIALVKPGDTIKVKARESLPNFSGTYKVDYLVDDGFLYGVSGSCDGYTMPFWAIEEIAIVKAR